MFKIKGSYVKKYILIIGKRSKCREEMNSYELII